MAKKSLIARELKKIKVASRLGKKKEAIKNELKSEFAKENPDYVRIDELNLKMNKMPRNSSVTRVQRRCNCCGRPRAVIRRFGLCRICLRQRLMNGEVSGGTKSSW